MINYEEKNPLFWTDGYKMCHKDQYPKNTEWVYETWTPRKSRIEDIDHVVFYGLQGVLAELNTNFKEHFFSKPIEKIAKEYKELVYDVYHKTNREFASNVDTTHIEKLHKLGYLPIKVKALKEGTFVPIGVPMFTIENTLPEFYWLPGYLETQLSAYIWQSMTAATVADKYKRVLKEFAKVTGDMSKVENLAGDFAMRGMSSPESALRVAGGHLLSFNVSSTVGARNYLMKHYNAARDVVTYSPSTEHSVICSYGRDEYNAFKHLLTKVYPSGNFSVVSDSYDFWNVIDDVLPRLKDVIMNRNGKLVIRPDSGNPVDILCGNKDAKTISEQKGLIERLYETFGGTKNDKGYIELDPHIGAVYGDAITAERAQAICKRLKDKGFASTNVIFGIGSYTYQYNTRDTFGFALKATAEIEDGKFKMIQKAPKTDLGNFKKSQAAMVVVVEENGKLIYRDGLNPQQEKEYDKLNLLKEIYRNGEFMQRVSFDEIRELVKNQSEKIYGHRKLFV